MLALDNSPASGSLRPTLRRFRNAALLALLSAAAAASMAPAPVAAKGNGDEFFVVDCMLPPQIRKLGRSMTFLGPKRVIKTTGNDCEIRGGEYIAQDRASYGASLKAWMPEAQGGNPDAMNNVGEIFERGFKDYAAAADWYRKAADAGNQRAQMNLGMLYEQGLGVPQDAQVALQWYRKGSGLSDLVVDQAAIDAARAESAAEIRGLRQQIDELKSQLQAAEAKLGGLRSELGQKEKKAAAARGEVDQLRQQLAARKAQGGGGQAPASDAETARLRQELQRAEQQLAQREAKLAERNSELAVLREMLRQREEEAADRQARLETLKQQSSTSSETVAAIQAEMDARTREIEMLRSQLHKEAADTSKNVAAAQQTQEQAQALWLEVMTLRSQIALVEESGTSDAEVASLEAVIREREQALATRNAEVAELKQQIAGLSNRSEDLKYQITRIEDQDGGLPPMAIEIIEPKLAQFRGLPGIKLRSAVSEVVVVGKVVSKTPIMSLSINDRPVRVNNSNVFRGAVPVRGERTEVLVAAVDKSGARAETSFAIFGPGGAIVQSNGPVPAGMVAIDPKKVKFGRYHALVIGNNKFRHLPALDTAVNDANAVAKLLQSRYGFKVTLLLNANRYDILSALNTMREKLNQDDNLLIYYAGHGEMDRKNARGYWLPADAEKESTANWIAATDLTDVLNVMNARQVMIVADSCYSGALTRSILTRLDAGRTAEAQQAWLETMARKRSRTVLTSGGLSPVADSGGGEHSVFAKAFLDVLRGSNQVVSGQALFQDVAERVTYAMADIGFEQVPAYAPLMHAGHELGDFFFVPAL